MIESGKGNAVSSMLQHTLLTGQYLASVDEALYCSINIRQSTADFVTAKLKKNVI